MLCETIPEAGLGRLHSLGCTAGKGNLIVVDNEKQALTFYSRDQNRAMRIYFQGDVFGLMDSLRLKAAAGQLSTDEFFALYFGRTFLDKNVPSRTGELLTREKQIRIAAIIAIVLLLGALVLIQDRFPEWQESR